LIVFFNSKAHIAFAEEHPFVSFQDDCCDRSVVESEVSTLHSQDDMASEHKAEILDESAMSAEAGSKGSANSRCSHGGMSFVHIYRLIFNSLIFVQRIVLRMFLTNNYKRIIIFRGFVTGICRKMERYPKMGRSNHGDKSILIAAEKTSGAIGEL